VNWVTVQIKNVRQPLPSIIEHGTGAAHGAAWASSHTKNADAPELLARHD
jgi:hypothetical protein